MDLDNVRFEYIDNSKEIKALEQVIRQQDRTIKILKKDIEEYKRSLSRLGKMFRIVLEKYEKELNKW